MERLSASHRISLGGNHFVTAGVVTGMFALGSLRDRPRLKRTSILAAEAFIDSNLIIAALKGAAGRLRPDSPNGRGKFFHHGTSFPSGHAANAWSVATVFALEYDEKPAVKYGAYTIAASVSAARYAGRAHFISDVVIGSAIGFYTGRFVFRKRHNRPATNERPANTTQLFPILTPVYDQRYATYGLRATWRL